MPTITVIPHGYRVEPPRHTPRHRSASRPRPILKAAAEVVKEAFTFGHDRTSQYHRTHTRAKSTPSTHTSVYYVDTYRHRDHDEHRGRERDWDRHREKEVRYYKEDERRHREPSRHRAYRVEEPKREEHKRDHQRVASEHAVQRYVGGQRYQVYHPATHDAIPKKSRRHDEYDMDELARKFGANMQVTYAQTNAFYAAPPPSPNYYPQGFIPYPPPSPRYAAPVQLAAPVIPGYAPTVYNGHY